MRPHGYTYAWFKEQATAKRKTNRIISRTSCSALDVLHCLMNIDATLPLHCLLFQQGASQPGYHYDNDHHCYCCDGDGNDDFAVLSRRRMVISGLGNRIEMLLSAIHHHLLYRQDHDVETSDPPSSTRLS